MTDQIVERTAVIHLDGEIDAVFPLFTALGEYHWIPGWKAEFIYPASGEPMTNNVFTTRHADQATTTWVTVDYDPAAHHVEYANVTPDSARAADRDPVPARRRRRHRCRGDVHDHRHHRGGQSGLRSVHRSRLRRAHGVVDRGDQPLHAARRIDRRTVDAPRGVERVSKKVRPAFDPTPDPSPTSGRGEYPVYFRYR